MDKIEEKDWEELDHLKELLEKAGMNFDEVERKEKKEEEEEEMKDDFDFDDYFDEDEKNYYVPKETEPEETFEEAISFLDDMVGMEQIKEKLMRLARYVRWKTMLQKNGMDVSQLPEPNLVFMFLGEPGTGKTTVANRMGRILHSIGLLSSRKTMVFHREDLVGENYGAEEINTREALNKSMGSVFFLDETYQCFKQASDHRDPGYHILETMMAQFGQPGRCIIMAGYKKEMEEIFKVNHGFRSRIPDENIIEFKPTTEKLLMDVAKNIFKKTKLQVTSGARQLLKEAIHIMFLQKDSDFGNARVIRQLAENIIINHANRIMKNNLEKDSTKITSADIRLTIANLQKKKNSTRSKIGFIQ